MIIDCGTGFALWPPKIQRHFTKEGRLIAGRGFLVLCDTAGSLLTSIYNKFCKDEDLRDLRERFQPQAWSLWLCQVEVVTRGEDGASFALELPAQADCDPIVFHITEPLEQSDTLLRLWRGE